MISILVHGPDFACSENLTQALGLLDDTQLISLHPAQEWRGLDPGLPITDDTLIDAVEVVERSSIVFLGDATAFETLRALSPVNNWTEWAKGLHNLTGFFGDSAYFNDPDYYDKLCLECDMHRLFLLPNLMTLTNLDAVPLHHPMQPIDADKTEQIKVMHSPGYANKRTQKGTNAIESVIDGLREHLEFDYLTIEGKTLRECLRLKAKADVFIDQLPPKGSPFGLGRSGLEGLAAGCATLSKMYSEKVLSGYFDPPPVVNVKSARQLRKELTKIIENETHRQRLQNDALEWINDNVAFRAWLEYLERHL